MSAVCTYLREFNFPSVLLRLILAVLVGGMIGMERGRKRRAAGVRTYMIVCLGATLAMLFSHYEYTMLSTYWAALAQEIGIKTDISRFGAQVINGIGFIGAGTIIVTGREQQIKGLTTAAGLWASACMGLAIGSGFYQCVIPAFFLMFLTIRFFPIIDNYILKKSKILNIFVEFESLDNVGTIINCIKSQGAQIRDIELNRDQNNNDTKPSIVFSLNLVSHQTQTQILSALSDLDFIRVIKAII